MWLVAGMVDRLVRRIRIFGPNIVSFDVALMRDTSKLVALGSGTTAFAKAQIQIYSPAGEGILLFSVVTSRIYLYL